jgi:nudix-type nucleoside diphosphatase (YffH/AdpP family)
MAGLRAKVLGLTEVYRGWSTVSMAEVETDRGTHIRRQVEDHGHAVAVLPYDPERRTALLVRQLRTGPLVAGDAEPYLLEAPAGMIDAGETPDAAARREALEEVGVRPDELVDLGLAYSCPGVSTETLRLYLAACSASDRIAAGGGLAVEDEEIEVVEVGLDALAAMAGDGRIRDMKTLILVLRLRLDQPGLFA